MALGILALKVGMTQVFDEKGVAHPVTILQAGPCPVLQIRTVEKDGYNAVQLGFLDKSRKRATRAERGHVSAELSSKRRERISQGATGDTMSPKADCEPQKFVREFRLEEAAAVAVGVDVIGTTKGRGFSGGMKRWNFHGLPASHGAKKVHRSIGSTSSLASNRGFGRPKKGKKMPGQYGDERVTVRNLDVIRIDADNHVILVRGGVPGFNGALVMIRPTNKIKRKAQN